MIKVGSDFSGVGAFNQALMRLGIEYRELFACDMDKFARQTFIHNYGEREYYPMNVYDREIPEESLDIYMTSPPCQAFSLAGKRLGKDDKRGILFFNSHEFIQKNKPRYFIFENVKGLLSDDGGKTFSEWLNMLGGKSINAVPVLFPYEDSVPYHIYWKVLNAKEHGVPQNRERVFILGIRDDEDNSFRWPVEETLCKKLKDLLEENVDDKYFLSDAAINKCLKSQANENMLTDDIPESSRYLIAGYYKQPFDGQYLKIGTWRTHKDDNGFREIENGNCPTIPARAREDGSGQPVIVIPVLTPDREKKRQNGRRFKNDGDEMFTITTQDRHGIYDGYKIRRLTPRECFRLMDFPDSFTWPVSDSQAYKQAGNSIVVRVLEKIINNLSL